MISLAPTLEGFFTDRLMRQRHASPNTVAAYRDTFCLLLRAKEYGHDDDPLTFPLPPVLFGQG